MNSFRVSVASIILMCSSYVNASETESGYIFIGLFTCAPSLAFIICMLWLIKTFISHNAVSVALLVVALLGVIPFGVSFTEYGAPYPNWIAYTKNMTISLRSNLALSFLILAFYTLYRLWVCKIINKNDRG